MATEIKKPNTENNVAGYFQNLGNAYDTLTAGDETTYSDCPARWCDADYLTGDGAIAYYGWTNTTETYTTLNIYVKWRLEAAAGNDTWGIHCSIDAGANWDYTILTEGTNDQITIQQSSVSLTVALPVTMSNLRVRITSNKQGGSDNNSLRVYDIWTEGEYSTRRIFHII